ncbi:MAG: hypothetical protein GY807_14230 [Gammaproteobacteria bacterium]|nr:hypothetical protein [Gammaproteobacteria bacterium]
MHFILVAALMLALHAPTAGASCTPTPHHTTGTHYQPVTEQRVDIGSGVTVHGRILAAPNCKLVTNARVAHWQAGEDGYYADRLRAYLLADAEGRYAFETEWPALSPPHIHFIITAEGYQALETQWIGDTRTRNIEFDMVLRPVATK